MARRGDAKPRYLESKGLWVVGVRGLDADGNRTRPHFYGKTADEAREKAEDYLVAQRTGLRPPGVSLTVGRHLYDWLDAVKADIRPSTFVSYEGHVRMHLRSLHAKPLTKLSPNDVRRLKADLLAAGLAPRTVAYSLVILRMALKQAVDDRLLPFNPATVVELPKVDRERVVIWQPATVRAFLDATRDDRLGPLWAVLLGTGLRLGEGLGLRWPDVDLTAGTLSVSGSIRPVDRRLRDEGQPRLTRVPPKTDAGYRTIDLPPFVVAALGRVGEQPEFLSRYVFVDSRYSTGSPLDPRNVSRVFEDTMARTGVPRIRVHDLRHTAASLMLAAGMTLDDVKRVLGHSSIVQTSDTYGHLVHARGREVAAAMERAVTL